MHYILNFIIKFRNTILYLVLLFISLIFTIQSHSYHSSKFIGTTNSIVGCYYKCVNYINDYFDLRRINNDLLTENTALRNQIEYYRCRNSTIVEETFNDTIVNYIYRSAKVINNTIHKTENYLTLDKGRNHGIKNDMGVITHNGVIGIIEQTSANYSRVISILNTNVELNVKLKKTDHFGTLKWDGAQYNLMKLIDIPSLANVKIGDTIISGGMSTIFPKGIPIGKITNFEQNEGQSFYSIDIMLFNDMYSIESVYIVENKNKEEIFNLEDAVK